MKNKTEACEKINSLPDCQRKITFLTVSLQIVKLYIWGYPTVVYYSLPFGKRIGVFQFSRPNINIVRHGNLRCKKSLRYLRAYFHIWRQNFRHLWRGDGTWVRTVYGTLKTKKKSFRVTKILRRQCVTNQGFKIHFFDGISNGYHLAKLIHLKSSRVQGARYL